MGTKGMGGAFAANAFGTAERIADFAADLIAFSAVVEVKILTGRVAVFASTVFRYGERATASYCFQWFAGTFFDGGFEFSPVLLCPRFRWSRERRSGIDAELAIVFRSRLRLEVEPWFTAGKNFEKERNNGTEFVGGKLTTDPTGKFVK